jgi:hypothetical protein
MDTEKETKPPTDTLIEQMLSHLDTRGAYYSIVALEKLATYSASLVRTLVVGLLLLQMFVFLSFGLAFWLGALLGSTAKGFGMAALIFLPLAALGWFFIKPLVFNKIISTFLQDASIQSEQ